MSIVTGVGSPGAMSSASGGKTYAYNNITSAGGIQVAPANNSRTKLVFHNPGANNIYIYSQYAVNTGSNVAQAPTTVLLGGTFLVYGNGGQLTVDGECQGAWFALAATGITNPFTVMDSNL